MNQESADKLTDRELHGFETLVALSPIILVGKGNGMVVEVDDPAV